jgi:hypothetical protein
MAGKKGMHKKSHFDGRPVQEQTKTDLRHAPVDTVVEVHPGGKLRALTYYNGKGLGRKRAAEGSRQADSCAHRRLRVSVSDSVHVRPS